MYVKVSKVAGKEYVQICHSVRIKGTNKTKQVVIEKLGLLSKLQEENPNILEDLKNKYQGLRNEARDNELLKYRVHKSIDALFDTEFNERNEFKDKLTYEEKAEKSKKIVRKKYGNLLYKTIYKKLKLDEYFDLKSKEFLFRYDLNNIVENLTFLRILKPSSKLRTVQSYDSYLIENDDTLKSHYRALEILCDERLDIIKHLNNRLSELMDRNLEEAFYDVTTVYFESFTADDFRIFGFSKDLKVNQTQVVLGLMIDANGIPISYKLFPGNTSDFKTFIPFIQEVKENLGIENVTIVADRGLNSGPNLQSIIDNGFKFIMAEKIRAKGKIASEILDLDSYDKITENYFIRDRKDTKFVKNEDDEKYIIDGRLVLSFSENRRKKDESDRKRLIEKALKGVQNNASKARSELSRGGRKYLDYNVKEVTIKTTKIEDDAKWDGFYGIFTNDMEMKTDRIISTYRKLWKIEDSFRMLKTSFEVRPVYLSKRKTIEGHFLICYLALVLQRFLEFTIDSIVEDDHKFTTEKILNSIREVELITFKDYENDTEYFMRTDEPIEYLELIEKLNIERLPLMGKVDEIEGIITHG
ncbi:IS1634 family transposase [Mycoplasmopsis caviae]|uniref:Transposase n=4 Tax=Mycoplasmopsis caviae TaxID=55603 RepID=A0A3P8MF68_9BACT|nr:IS1634 family transposase [Mycoplasmopsis caviae]VDR41660.1 Transposase [Mycoplasmopsis caviae]VDR41773.1 Transposase [Mycoplasmopsis caviae]VDR42272.1 Transposase [Mycoplasmopsis caviae]